MAQRRKTVELNLVDQMGVNYCIQVSPDDATRAKKGK